MTFIKRLSTLAHVQVELVSVWCPSCKEAHYGPDDHDWSGMTFEGHPELRRANHVETCRTCGIKFKLPAIVRNLGK